MRFADVMGTLLEDQEGYRLIVTLDTRTRAVTVRDERVPQLLKNNGVEDALWTVDQLTQETIGTDLAQQGWEAVAQGDSHASEAGAPPSVRYLLRGG